MKGMETKEGLNIEKLPEIIFFKLNFIKQAMLKN